MKSLTDALYLWYYAGMSELYTLDNQPDFEDVFGDLDLTMLHHGEKHRVFVYGTLMANMRNHHRIDVPETKLLADRALVYADFHMFPMKTSGNYLAPIVVYGEPGEPKGIVHGELYQVDNNMLMTLDMFEGHPLVYRRMWVSVIHNNEAVNAWMYIYANERPLNQILEADDYNAIQKTDGPQGSTHYRWVGEKV